MAHYSKAPITEALIDVRVSARAGLTLSSLDQLHLRENNSYPDKKRLVHIKGHFTGGPDQDASAHADQTEHGLVCSSTDQRQIFQARIDGFTFTRLAPYDRWESFRDEARHLWDAYRMVAEPEQVTRIAVRYVNRLDLPLPLRDFKDYLRTVPEVSPALPQELTNFFMQLHIPQDDLDAMLLLNQAMIPPAREGVVSVVLDIDLFRSKDLSDDDDSMWGIFEQLHTRKNDIFEGCITDLTRELIR